MVGCVISSVSFDIGTHLSHDPSIFILNDVSVSMSYESPLDIIAAVTTSCSKVSVLSFIRDTNISYSRFDHFPSTWHSSGSICFSSDGDNIEMLISISTATAPLMVMSVDMSSSSVIYAFSRVLTSD